MTMQFRAGSNATDRRPCGQCEHCRRAAETAPPPLPPDPWAEALAARAVQVHEGANRG